MAAHIVWDIVRRESSFLRKSHGIELSADPLNVTGSNSFSASGLAQAKALGVSLVTPAKTKQGEKAKSEKIQLLSRSKANKTVVTFLTHGTKRAVTAINKVRPCGSCAVLSRGCAHHTPPQRLICDTFDEWWWWW